MAKTLRNIRIPALSPPPLPSSDENRGPERTEVGGKLILLLPLRHSREEPLILRTMLGEKRGEGGGFLPFPSRVWGKPCSRAGNGICKLLRSPGIDSASLCSLAGVFDNPIPTRFLVPIDWSKIPAQGSNNSNYEGYYLNSPVLNCPVQQLAPMFMLSV